MYVIICHNLATPPRPQNDDVICEQLLSSCKLEHLVKLSLQRNWYKKQAHESETNYLDDLYRYDTVKSRIPDHHVFNHCGHVTRIQTNTQSYTSQLQWILTALYSCSKTAMVGKMVVQFADRWSGILDWTVCSFLKIDCTMKIWWWSQNADMIGNIFGWSYLMLIPSTNLFLAPFFLF